MRLIVAPGRALGGEARPPGDKSISHRAALFASLAEGESRVDNLLVAGVTKAMLSALSGLGVTWRLERTRLTVSGRGPAALRSPDVPLDCGNSGTTLRLLAGALAGAGVAATLDGTAGLRRRPMRRIVDPLTRMGVSIQASEGGTAPLTLGARPSGSKLGGMEHTLPVASAQVKSAILLAGLGADGETTVREPAPSRDHTERLLQAMGATVLRDPVEGVVTIHPPAQPLRPLDVELPGDFSAAAFLMVSAAIVPGSSVLLRSVGINATRTGLLDTLRAMGADIRIERGEDRAGEPVADITVHGSALRGVEVGGETVVRMIDEFPAFAVAASVAEGATTVRDAAELRGKESDRIGVLCRELAALGGAVEERVDGFHVRGARSLAGGVVRSHGDHRIALALALAGLVSDHPVVVEDAEIVGESFPAFAETLRSLGANAETSETP